MKVGEVN